MKYDASKLMFDQQTAVYATELFDKVKPLIISDKTTGEILNEIGLINPDKTVILDTINLVLGWLTFPKEGDKDLELYRGTIDIRSQYLAGVEY